MWCDLITPETTGLHSQAQPVQPNSLVRSCLKIKMKGEAVIAQYEGLGFNP